MARRTLLTVLVTATLAAANLAACHADPSPMEAARTDGWSRYGAADRESGDTVAIGALRGDRSGVIVEGTITDVCRKKGCWMRVTDGSADLFVRFQDYGFFVPMNAAGHRVVMHGTSVAQVISVDELRHYAEDAGKTAEEIAAITEPETGVTFFADSVYIEGDDLDAPYDGE